MSTTIDQKVVEMRFDNAEFEKNVSQSISSLDALKSSLDFGNLSNGLDKIGNSISGISNKLSPLGEVWRQLWRNLGDVAFSTIAQIQNALNSLGFEQVIAGFNKYTLVSKATQTIMAATRKEWSDQVAQMQYVNGEIEKLAWFTDETSYNLIDMTSNIGKFVAAGVKLDDAVSAMMGIATWAGISGANINQASAAMYNLAQAMGVGYVRTIDWMSIENANMATQEFKQSVIETAYELGKLKKNNKGEYYIPGTGKPAKYKVDRKTGKKIKTKDAEPDMVVTPETLRSTLSKKWFDAEVLTKVLNQYGDFSKELYEQTKYTQRNATELLGDLKEYKELLKNVKKTAGDLKEKDPNKVKEYIQEYYKGTLDLDKVAKKYGISVEDLKKHFEQYRGTLLDFNEIKAINDDDIYKAVAYKNALDKLSKSEYELGYQALKASQESRTLEDSIVATKDAISSTWMKIFQEVLGDYLESVELWSSVSEELWDLFVEDLDNTYWLVKEWGELGGREILIEGIETAWTTIKSVISTVKDELHQVFPELTGEKLISITEKFRDFTKELKLTDLQMLQIRVTVSYIGNIIKNVWKTISGIFKALIKAFNEIFPKTESWTQSIYKLFRGLSKLSDKLSLTDERASKLTRVFKGVFSVLDIFRMLIVAILKPLTGFDDTAMSLGDSILDMAANFGDWLTGLRNAIKETDIFGKIINGIIGFFKGAAKAVDDFIYALTNKHFKEILSEISENAKKAKEDIGSFFSLFASQDASKAEKSGFSIKSIFEAITEGIKSLKKQWEEAKPYFDEMMSTINDTFEVETMTYDDFLAALRKGGALALIFYIIYGFIELKEWFEWMFLDTPKMMGNFVNNLTLIIEGVSESLWNVSKRIKAGVITKIARAVLYLAVAIALIASIKEDKLENALAVVILMFASLVGTLEALEKTTSALDTAKVYAIGKTLRMMGTAVLLIGAGLAIVAKSSKRAGDIEEAGIALGILLAAMAGLLYLLSEKAMVDPKRMSGISSAMTILGFALIEFAAALAIVTAVSSKGNLGAATAAIAAMMLAVGIFFKAMDDANINPGRVLVISAAMGVLGFALIEFAASLAILVAVGDDSVKVAVAVAALAVMLLAVAVAVNSMPTNLPLIAAGLMLVGIALLEMSVSLAIVAEAAKDETFMTGLQGLIGLLAVLTVALMALGTIKGSVIEGAAAITVASVGIVLLAKALNELSAIHSLDGVIVMGAALLVLIAAAALAEKVATGLLVLGGALALIGVGALASGTGMLKFAEGVEKLVAAGNEGVDVLIYFFEQLGGVIPGFLAALGDGIAKFISVLFIENSAIILEALSNLFATILEAIKITLPLVWEVLKQFFYGFKDFVVETMPILLDVIAFLTREILKFLVSITPDITAAAIALLLDTLRQVLANIAEVTMLATQIAIEIIVGFIQALINEIPRLVEVSWQFVIAFIEGIATGIDNHIEDLKKAIIHLAEAIINAFCTLLGIHSPSSIFDGFGGNIVQGLINGISSMISKAEEIFWDLADKILTAFCEKFGIEKTGSAKEMFNLAVQTVKGWISGIGEWIGKAKDKIKELADGVLTKFCEIMGIEKPTDKSELGSFAIKIIQQFNAGIFGMIDKAKNMIVDLGKKVIDGISKFLGIDNLKNSEMYKIGIQTIQGMIDGIIKKGADLVGKAKNVVNSAVKGIKDLLGIHSPSKVLEDVGVNTDQGFINGLLKYASKVQDAAVTVGNTAIDGVTSAISNISQMVEDGIDTQPTIRPVLDLSGVSDGIGLMDDMMSANRSVGLASSTGIGFNNGLANKLSASTALDDLMATISGDYHPGDTINNTFNITGDDPRAIAEEVGNILQADVERRNAVWGR
ncbi:MAG: hypothetical protein J6Y02_21710 [Pseudobutyrivibrio sp.]|nr:hypothetical protein [Pseudobutyrivibrio sp.]